MKHAIRPLARAAVAAVVLAACSDRGPVAPPVESPDPLLQKIAAMGFRTGGVEDHGSYFVVEGDIRLEKAALRSAPSGEGGPLSPRFQYHTTSLVGPAKVYQLRVDLSGLGAEPAWQTAARSALAQWNATGSYVYMVEGTPADITFSLGCLNASTAAQASWPGGGNPGSAITVNQASCLGLGQNDQQRLRNMVHEIGHTLGFRHSNWVQTDCDGITDTNCGSDPIPAVGAVQIPGTPGSGNDPGSVMNGQTALAAWAGFSSWDLYSIRQMYPLPVAAASVSNSGGVPLVSWSALAGASSYTVTLVHSIIVTSRVEPSWSEDETELVGGTTGTSVLDPARAYTGVSECRRDFPNSTTRRDLYRYHVAATFPTGTSTRIVHAPVADC
jgi:hypothetical protein